ncbi:MAG: 30S ribosomal protein S14 [Myxococcota bacterium]|jgi:small subunit ribosomal protein S14
MAKKGQLNREKKRFAMSDRLAEKRTGLKKKIIDPNLSDDERREAMFALNKMPRDAAKARRTFRCQKTGVSRAVYRKFQLNRIAFREMALAGMLPGVTKASW